MGLIKSECCAWMTQEIKGTLVGKKTGNFGATAKNESKKKLFYQAAKKSKILLGIETYTHASAGLELVLIRKTLKSYQGLKHIARSHCGRHGG